MISFLKFSYEFIIEMFLVLIVIKNIMVKRTLFAILLCPLSNDTFYRTIFITVALVYIKGLCIIYDPFIKQNLLHRNVTHTYPTWSYHMPILVNLNNIEKPLDFSFADHSHWLETLTYTAVGRRKQPFIAIFLLRLHIIVFS